LHLFRSWNKADSIPQRDAVFLSVPAERSDFFKATAFIFINWGAGVGVICCAFHKKRDSDMGCKSKCCWPVFFFQSPCNLYANAV
ncbi:MAG: hypothetical protein IJN11_00150, partial [Oscillospiraceae bacterium]|nr:hypothetical protein [Oscillospiraceae bacterium]